MLEEVAKGDIGMARRWIEAGADVDTKDAKGRTALMHAARVGQRELAELLLDNKADVNATDNVGQTPLMYAAGWRHLASLKALLKAGVNLHARDKKGRTALTWCANDGPDTSEAKTLQIAGATVGGMEAVMLGDTEQALRLIGAGDKCTVPGPRGENALMYASRLGSLTLVRSLIQIGQNPNRVSGKGASPLHWAMAGEPSVSMSGLGYLRQHPNSSERIEIVRTLVKAGAKINAGTKPTNDYLVFFKGSTPLMWAAASGDTEMVKALLQMEADRSIKDEYGRTAAEIAHSFDHEEIAKLLNDSRQKADRRTKRGLPVPPDIISLPLAPS